MGAVKAIALELEELDVDVNFDNADDLFDLVIDTQLSNHMLSPLMVEMIWGVLRTNCNKNNPIDRLWDSQEFLDGMAWHEGEL